MNASHQRAPAQDFQLRYRKKSAKAQDPAGQGRQDFARSSQIAGNLATERLLRSAEFPSRLTINPPGDVHEQEAEKLTEQVVDAPEGTTRWGAEFITPGSQEPKRSFGLSLGSGHPLDAASRTFFEPRFGVDLSQVRLHTDIQAAASAEAVDAEAFTIGLHVVFGAGRYNPMTHDGKRLLAHELAHAVQQNPASLSPFNPPAARAHTGAAAVIQRQPTPDAVSMQTDPVAFIEQQLRRRFTEPTDPLLIARVRRLQEAFGLLNNAEARGLLDRLRDPGDELARNFQRLATPSRNRLRAILLRGLPAEIEGKLLGWLSTDPATTVQTPLVATLEVTPSTVEAGLFEGYISAEEAQASAERCATISAIVLDKKLGRYRVFETGVPTVRGPHLRVAVTQTGLDYQLIDWVNLEGEEQPSPQDIAVRIGKAKKLLDDYQKIYGRSIALPGGVGATTSAQQQEAAWKEVEDAYRLLFEQAVPFAQGEFNFSLEFDAPATGDQPFRRLTTANYALINVDLLDMYVHGRQKVLDPMEDPSFPGTHRRVSTREALEETSPSPFEPYFTLAPSSLSEEPLHTRSVVLHEEAHRTHDQRTIQLIEDWKTPGQTKPFKDWIESEVKNRRVSAVDAILAIEDVEHGSGWAFNTELLAEVEGFISVYHAMPLGKDLGLERLRQMGDMWINSASEIQELGVRKLHHYYSQILDRPHRDAFDQYVGKQWQEANQAPASSPLKARVAFYLRLAEFYEIH